MKTEKEKERIIRNYIDKKYDWRNFNFKQTKKEKEIVETNEIRRMPQLKF